MRACVCASVCLLKATDRLKTRAEKKDQIIRCRRQWHRCIYGILSNSHRTRVLFFTLSHAPALSLHSRLAPNHLFDSHARIFFLIDRRIDNERQ